MIDAITCRKCNGVCVTEDEKGQRLCILCRPSEAAIPTQERVSAYKFEVLAKRDCHTPRNQSDDEWTKAVTEGQEYHVYAVEYVRRFGLGEGNFLVFTDFGEFRWVNSEYFQPIQYKVKND